MRRIRKCLFKRHFDQLQREDGRRVPDHKHRVNDSAQGLGIVPREVEDDVERPRGNAELQQGGDSRNLGNRVKLEQLLATSISKIRKNGSEYDINIID